MRLPYWYCDSWVLFAYIQPLAPFSSGFPGEMRTEAGIIILNGLMMQ
jgi:hypothetical protein